MGASLADVVVFASRCLSRVFGLGPGPRARTGRLEAAERAHRRPSSSSVAPNVHLHSPHARFAQPNRSQDALNHLRAPSRHQREPTPTGSAVGDPAQVDFLGLLPSSHRPPPPRPPLGMSTTMATSADGVLIVSTPPSSKLSPLAVF